MEIFNFDLLKEFLVNNREWIGPTVSFVSFIETLAFVGYVVPGVPMLFALGMLAATIHIPWWELCLWGVMGAALGDSISYQFGFHFHSQLRSWKVFKKHPDWIVYGENFFYKHGDMSIALGRFIGPIRPIIPVVAGMMNMSIYRFYLVNILSSFVWAPVYLLPGFYSGKIIQQYSDILVIFFYWIVFFLFISMLLPCIGIWINKIIVRKNIVPLGFGFFLFILSGFFYFIDYSWGFSVGNELYELIASPFSKWMYFLSLSGQAIWLWIMFFMIYVLCYRHVSKSNILVAIIGLCLFEIVLFLLHFLMDWDGDMGKANILSIEMSRIVLVWLWCAGLLSATHTLFYRWVCFSLSLFVAFVMGFSYYLLNIQEAGNLIIGLLFGSAYYNWMVVAQRIYCKDDSKFIV